MHWGHMETFPFPDWKDLLKSSTVQTMRHDCRNEFRNFSHVDVSEHRFVCQLAQNHRRGLEITLDLYGVNGCRRPAPGIKPKVVYRRIHNPRDFHLSGSFPLADDLFVAGRSRNAYLCSGI